MIKPLSEKPENKIQIDLSGPQGNAFYLIGTAKSLGKQLEIDYQPIIDEMMSSDFDNLVEVFDRHFGEYVVIYR